MPVFKFNIESMVCPTCEETAVNALTLDKQEKIEIKSVKPSFLNKTVTVTVAETDIPDDRIQQFLMKKLEDCGLEAKPKTGSYWVKGAIGLFAGTIMMAICLSGISIPFISMSILGGISSLLTLYLGKDTYKHAAKQLVEARSLSMESLLSVSTLLALGISCISLFVPGLPMLFDTALFILGFKNIGTAINEAAKKHVFKTSFRSLAPPTIEVVGVAIPRPIQDLVPDDIIIVRSGQTVPVDALCLEAQTSLYTTCKTGDALPQSITDHQMIYAGSVVPEDVPFIKMKVITKEADSYLAQLDKNLQKIESEKESEKAPIEIFTHKILRYFIRAVFAIAIISAIVTSFFISPVAGMLCAISVLASACPCILGIIIPMAVSAGITKAAKQGVIFKNSKSIQNAAEVDTLVFDLTGTLTGIPSVTRTTVPRNMFSYVTAIEKKSANLIGKAIFRYAQEHQEEGMLIDDPQVDTIDQTGIAATINNQAFVLGNRDRMKKLGLNTRKADEELKAMPDDHVIYMVRNNEIMGAFLVENPLRDDAKQTIQACKDMGFKIRLCTGTPEALAKKRADELGIPHHHIQAGHHLSKTDYIIRQGPNVAMIGDGVNDTEAMAASRFSIALKPAATTTIPAETASATIDNRSLWPIINAFAIARQTKANLKQNLIITHLYNLVAMIGFGGLFAAAGFLLNPAIGAALMIGQVIFVLANLERFKNQAIPAMKKNVVPSRSTYNHLIPRLMQSHTQPQLQPLPSPVIGVAHHYLIKSPRICVDDREEKQLTRIFHPGASEKVQRPRDDKARTKNASGAY